MLHIENESNERVLIFKNGFTKIKNIKGIYYIFNLSNCGLFEGEKDTQIIIHRIQGTNYIKLFDIIELIPDLRICLLSIYNEENSIDNVS